MPIFKVPLPLMNLLPHAYDIFPAGLPNRWQKITDFLTEQVTAQPELVKPLCNVSNNLSMGGSL